jgi:peptide deformylase
MASQKVDGVEQVGNKILKQKALSVPHFGEREKAIVAKMKEILIKASGIGLAAPQIGESKQIILVGTPDKKLQKELGMGFFVLINPKIIDQSEEEEIVEEGCLSFMQPEIRAKVARPLYIKVEAHNEKGQLIELEAFDLMARSICHEVDHLHGVLFTDKADPASIYEYKVEGERTKVIG